MIHGILEKFNKLEDFLNTIILSNEGKFTNTYQNKNRNIENLIHTQVYKYDVNLAYLKNNVEAYEDKEIIRIDEKDDSPKQSHKVNKVLNDKNSKENKVKRKVIQYNQKRQEEAKENEIFFVVTHFNRKKKRNNSNKSNESCMENDNFEMKIEKETKESKKKSDAIENKKKEEIKLLKKLNPEKNVKAKNKKENNKINENSSDVIDLKTILIQRGIKFNDNLSSSTNIFTLTFVIKDKKNISNEFIVSYEENNIKSIIFLSNCGNLKKMSIKKLYSLLKENY